MSTKDTNPKDVAATTKVPLWLLSPIASAHWALAQFSGMTKYGAWNWRVAGVRSSVYLSAAMRHLAAYLSGEETDPVDGTHHLGNVMACCAILLDARAAGTLTDDRPPSVDLRTTYGELEKRAEKLRAQYADKAPRHYTIEDTVAAVAGVTGPKEDCQCQCVAPSEADLFWHARLRPVRGLQYEVCPPSGYSTPNPNIFTTLEAAVASLPARVWYAEFSDLVHFEWHHKP